MSNLGIFNTTGKSIRIGSHTLRSYNEAQVAGDDSLMELVLATDEITFEDFMAVGEDWRDIQHLLASGSIACESDWWDWWGDMWDAAAIINVTRKPLTIGKFVVRPRPLDPSNRANNGSGPIVMTDNFDVEDTPHPWFDWGIDNDLLFTNADFGGNGPIHVEFVYPDDVEIPTQPGNFRTPNNSPLDISTGEGTIVVKLGTGSLGEPNTTANELIAAWMGNTDFSDLVTVELLDGPDNGTNSEGQWFMEATQVVDLSYLTGYAARDMQRLLASGSIIVDFGSETRHGHP